MDERMSILKMLEEGKITADEAARLLAAAGRGEAPGQERGFGSQYGEPRRHERPDMNVFAEDMRRKFDALARDMGPKLQKLTEVVVEKTAVAAEQLSKTIDEHKRGGWQAEHGAYGPAPARPGAERGGVMERSFELPVTSAGGELAIAGHNGGVTVRGYNGDKITARVTYKPARPDAEIDFKTYGDKYMLTWNDGDFKFISVDAYVPENLFDNVGVSTVNSSLVVSGLRARNVRLDNRNSTLDVSAVAAERIIAETSNAALNVARVEAAKASFETTNAAIRAEDADVAELRLASTNGGLTLRAAKLSAFDEYLWTLETSNAKLAATLPAGGPAYHIKAHAALAGVRVNLPGVTYLQNDKYATEAVTPGFEAAPRKLRLIAETSNGAVQID